MEEPTTNTTQEPSKDAQDRRMRRARHGTVSSAGGDQTIRVVVENLVRHPRYGKFIRRRTKLAAHDPRNQAAVGDLVEIVPCRPISKTKSWRLLRVVRRPEIKE